MAELPQVGHGLAMVLGACRPASATLEFLQLLGTSVEHKPIALPDHRLAAGHAEVYPVGAVDTQYRNTFLEEPQFPEPPPCHPVAGIDDHRPDAISSGHLQ